MKLSEIGRTYIARNRESKVLGTVLVVMYEDLIDVIGRFNPSEETYQEYMEKTGDMVDAEVYDSFCISWYTYKEDKDHFLNAVSQAVKEQNRIVIIEKITD